MPKKKTHDEFLHEICEVWGTKLSILTVYEFSYQNLKVRCNTCFYEWFARPTNLLNGVGCPACSRKRRKTTTDFIKELESISGNEYQILGSYINNKTPIEIRHVICGHIWNIRPLDFLNKGSRCPVCVTKRNTEQRKKNFVYELDNAVGNEYSVLTKYENNKSKVKLRHNECGHVFDVLPINFLNKGSRCPVCVTKRIAEQKNKNFFSRRTRTSWR
ncbi:hypothetical protein FQP34_00120 [Peribacillus simplex]|uniref:Zinc-ribbon domain-containing protein n=1 Tax=Peribacillus simplex TaxID=1478 RepID=A0A8B5Y3S1_9BACI|nr:hypothetical protein [Peribacillus simplex]TVX83699.1 hypothetical protein FQP34_00120 [Peribacillus simplex]